MEKERRIIYRDYSLWSIDEQEEFKEELKEGYEREEISDEFAEEENVRCYEDEFDEKFGNWREYAGDGPVVITGVLGLWDGQHEIIPVEAKNLVEAVRKCLEDENSIYEDEEGNFCIEAHHHDGVNHFKIMKYKDENNKEAGLEPINYLGE